MPNRKNSDNKYEVLHKKLKEIERELHCDRKIKRCRRRRVISSSSSSSNGSTARQSESRDCTPQRHVPVESDLQEAMLPIHVEEVLPSPEDNTPELDAEILHILGVDPTENIKFGKNIQKDVALRFEHTVINGVSKEDKKELTNKYLIPENCKLIGAPTLNPEVKAALSETVTKRDNAIAYKQSFLTTAISSLGKAITYTISSKEKNTELLQILMDTGRALCECQHSETLTRLNYIIHAVNKNMKESLKHTKIDDFLFGHNLQEALKTTKAINKSGAELRAIHAPKPSITNITHNQSIPSTSKNWKGSYPTHKPPLKKTDMMQSSTAVRNQRGSSFKKLQNQRVTRAATHNRR